MKPYSLDFRRKIVETYFDEPISQRKLAKRFHISLSFVEKLLKQLRETGDLSPKPHGGGQMPKLNAQQLELLSALVETHNDATLAELCELLEQETEVSLSSSSMWRVLQQLNLTRKKKRCTPVNATHHGFSRLAWTTGKPLARLPLKT